MKSINLNNAGLMAIGSTAGSANIDYQTHNIFDDAVVLFIKFKAKVANPTSAEDFLCRMQWVDSTNGDNIYTLQGTLSESSNDESFGSGLLADVAMESGFFKAFDVALSADVVDAILASDAYEALDESGNQGVSLLVGADTTPTDTPTLYDLLTTLDDRPSEICVVSMVADLPVFNECVRASKELNVPFTHELASHDAEGALISVASITSMVTALDIKTHLLQHIWSPNVARPRDALSIRGRKYPAYAIGKYLAYKALRNARTTAQGIPKIADPIAGEPYSFDLPGIEPALRLTQQDIEELAKAKINVVRRIKYDTGVKFVLSDVLTQYDSKNSALRLVNATEIACYTTNRCIDILKRHMLKKTTSFLTDAGRDIQNFLDGSVSAGLLKSAQDLGGKPYEFSLVPDEQYPFERVRFYLARRPEGAVRAVIFDDDVIVK